MTSTNCVSVSPACDRLNFSLLSPRFIVDLLRGECSGSICPLHTDRFDAVSTVVVLIFRELLSVPEDPFDDSVRREKFRKRFVDDDDDSLAFVAVGSGWSTDGRE